MKFFSMIYTGAVAVIVSIATQVAHSHSTINPLTMLIMFMVVAICMGTLANTIYNNRLAVGKLNSSLQRGIYMFSVFGIQLVTCLLVLQTIFK